MYIEQVKVSNKSKALVREHLANFKETQKEIKDLREALLVPFVETDENIGGGRSNLVNDGSDRIIKAMSHRQITFRVKMLEAIELVLSRANDEAKRIIALRYFGDEEWSWVKVASHKDIHCSIDTCKRIERRIVEEIALLIGF